MKSNIESIEQSYDRLPLHEGLRVRRTNVELETGLHSIDRDFGRVLEVREIKIANPPEFSKNKPCHRVSLGRPDSLHTQCCHGAHFFTTEYYEIVSEDTVQSTEVVNDFVSQEQLDAIYNNGDIPIISNISRDKMIELLQLKLKEVMNSLVKSKSPEDLIRLQAVVDCIFNALDFTRGQMRKATGIVGEQDGNLSSNIFIELIQHLKELADS